MKKTFLLLSALLLTAPVAFAQDTYCYGWEDGGEVLGTYLPDQMYYANDGTVAYEGSYSLEIYELEGSGTPQAYVAWITGLLEGDVITASFQTWDQTETSNPSVRIWGHYTTPGGTIDDYAGSAGGNYTYSGGVDWVELSHSWTIEAAEADHGLVVECRPYNSDPWSGSCWIDQVCVTIPDHCTLYLPGDSPVANHDATWGQVRALYE